MTITLLKMEDKIIKIAADLFGVEVTRNSKIGDFQAWDSLGQINLFMAIENELGLFFDPDAIIENDSIEQIILLLENNR
jgi:acyl carrier protein